jgi:hypothetical protein
LIPIVFKESEVICLYNNAKGYDSANAKEYKWLSRGIYAIRSVLGYSGNISPIKKTHLIVIVGYEIERASKVIDLIEPVSLSLGYGKPHTAATQKDVEANEYYKDLIEQMLPSYASINTFEVMCDDPLRTSQILLEQAKSYEDHNVVVVPLNNKLTTIGVSVAASINTDIQVCYAPAITYNSEDYSEAGDYCYITKLPNPNEKNGCNS